MADLIIKPDDVNLGQTANELKLQGGFSLYHPPGVPGNSPGGNVEITGGGTDGGKGGTVEIEGGYGTTGGDIEIYPGRGDPSASLDGVVTIEDGRDNVRIKIDYHGLGFFGVTPIARPTVATGTGKTVDDVITALQALGLFKQS